MKKLSTQKAIKLLLTTELCNLLGETELMAFSRFALQGIRCNFVLGGIWRSCLWWPCYVFTDIQPLLL